MNFVQPKMSKLLHLCLLPEEQLQALPLAPPVRDVHHEQQALARQREARQHRRLEERDTRELDLVSRELFSGKAGREKKVSPAPLVRQKSLK